MKTCLFFILVILTIRNCICNKFENSFFNIIKELITEDEISNKCKTQFSEFISDFKLDASSWALRMLDATSKLQSGIMSLNIGEMGNFKQCIHIKTNKTKYGQILGKYCLGSLQINLNSTQENQEILLSLRDMSGSIPNIGDLANVTRAQGPTWAICLPDGCSAQDATILVNFAFNKIIGNIISIEFPDLLCQTYNDVYKNLSTEATIALICLGFIIFIILISTVYDFYCHLHKKAPKHLIFIAFSIYTNGQKLFRITKLSSDHLPCLNGLRFLSIVWVVAGHVYSLMASGPITNTLDLKNWSDTLYSMFLVSGTLSVDTFFVVGGALVVYGYRNLIHRKIPFNIPMFYFHRYLRLTPALAAVVLVSATLLSYLGSGPNWPLIETYFQNYCVNYWWSALLYVQNYVNVTTMCVGQTWYLSIDTQLYLVSPILLIPLIKRPKIVISFVVICILLSMGWSFYIAWTNELRAIVSNYYGNSENFNNKYYLLTHTRASAWLIGFILGHLIFEIKMNYIKFRPNKIVTLIAWGICLVILLVCALAGHNTLRQKEYDRIGNSFHIAFIRPAWSLAIAWVILACTSGYGGFINKILSLPIFQVLNRFTYSIYLTHVTMLYMITYSKKSPDYFSDFNAAYQFGGAIWFSFCLSLLLILAFESPAIAIEKIIFAPAISKSKREETKNEQQGSINLAFRS